MNTDEIMHQVKGFLSQFIKSTDLDHDLDLFTSGTLNSLFAMQLVLFIESDFDITVANEDLDLENFKSLNAIVNFITRKSSSPC